MLANVLLFLWCVAFLLLGAGLLHLLPRLGSAGVRLSEACCEAPLLDWVVFYFTGLPLIVGPWVGGWGGFLSAVFAQFVTYLIWEAIHEAVHRNATKGPRIVKVLNKRFGFVRNQTAVHITALVTPIFLLVRVAQVVLYPQLVALVNFPAYNAGDWVKVSRQKFGGLVGHDLIWCLYCDWMTGVWSLGTEMLRNVESFWCPIRFSCEKKCANCTQDFPDLDNGWVPANGTMQDVVETLHRQYPSPEMPQAWFGHPSRRPVETASRQEAEGKAESLKG